MTNKQKAELLNKRHLKIVIEWGGVEDMFLDCSDMSLDGSSEFLEILQLDDFEEINDRITILVQKEYERNQSV